MRPNIFYLRPNIQGSGHLRHLTRSYPLPITVASGKVDYVLTLEAGAYTYTGQAITFVLGRKLALDAGAYTYTGQAATFVFERKLALDAGAYNYVGNDATLDYVPGGTPIDYTLALEAGAYVYTGNDATLTYLPGSAAPAVRPMGWIGVSFRKRTRKDEEPEVVVELGEDVNPVEAAEYLASSLASEGIDAKDVAGMLADSRKHAKMRAVLEKLAAYAEVENPAGVELGTFVRDAIDDKIRLKILAKRNLDAIIAAILASEL